MSGDQGSSLNFSPNKPCGLGPELHFQIATCSRKTWVKAASAPMFAKFLISMLQNEKELAESLQEQHCKPISASKRSDDEKTISSFSSTELKNPCLSFPLVSVQRRS